jgi:predicted GNAT family acetyltransferase
MPDWKLFRKKTRTPQKVTSGRFEIERDGEVAYLEYTRSGDVLELIETIVPEKLRGAGLAGELAQTALEYARANGLKVDIVCPLVQGYITKHPEYADLVMK